MDYVNNNLHNHYSQLHSQLFNVLQLLNCKMLNNYKANNHNNSKTSDYHFNHTYITVYIIHTCIMTDWQFTLLQYSPSRDFRSTVYAFQNQWNDRYKSKKSHSTGWINFARLRFRKMKWENRHKKQQDKQNNTIKFTATKILFKVKTIK